MIFIKDHLFLASLAEVNRLPQLLPLKTEVTIRRIAENKFIVRPWEEEAKEIIYNYFIITGKNREEVSP